VIRIVLNGEVLDLDDGFTVGALLEHLAVRGTVAVELNRRVVPRDDISSTAIADGDVLEIVTFVGGG
jgi:sulfur carrier protein